MEKVDYTVGLIFGVLYLLAVIGGGIFGLVKAYNARKDGFWMMFPMLSLTFMMGYFAYLTVSLMTIMISVGKSPFFKAVMTYLGV